MPFGRDHTRVRSARVLIVAALLLTAGCSAGAASTTERTAPVDQPAAQSAPEPKGLTAAEQEFVDRISHEVDPVFAKYPDRYAGRGENSCYLIKEKAKNAAEVTVERFSGGTITINQAEAKKILAAAKDTVCAAD